jgi:hypothetical protein
LTDNIDMRQLTRVDQFLVLCRESLRLLDLLLDICDLLISSHHPLGQGGVAYSLGCLGLDGEQLYVSFGPAAVG